MKKIDIQIAFFADFIITFDWHGDSTTIVTTTIEFPKGDETAN